MAEGPKIDEAELARTIEKLANGQASDWSNPAPRFDPQVHKDMRDDALHGRSASSFKQALEASGWKWVPADRLGTFGDGRWNDGSRHTVGMWVNSKIGAAFTEDDIVMYFPEGPEELFKWTAARRATLIRR